MLSFTDSPPIAATEAAAPQSDQKRRVVPFHPLLFAAFPLLALYAQNVAKIPVHEIFSPLFKAAMGTLGLWLLFLLMTRHLRKAAMAASVIVLLFFSYRHILNVMPKGLHDLVLPAFLLALVCLLFAIIRTRQPLNDTTSVLNLAALVLLAPSCWDITTGLRANAIAIEQASAPAPGGNGNAKGYSATVLPQRHLSEAPQDVPDVYYIILDAYGRADRLKTYYAYDNTPFIQALEARGFTIPRHSAANYNQTPLCLASALSMNYLDERPNHRLTPEILRRMVDDNPIAAYLRKRGYHYINVWSGLEESRVTTADLVLNNQPDLSTLEGNMLGNTVMGASSTYEKKRYNEHRKRLLGGFNGLEKVAELPYPKFVFTHILAPHPPFVFGPNGEAIDPKGPLNLADASDLLQEITRAEYSRGYVAQLQYVNARVLEAVDTILRQSKHRPIIIIQGDHGSRMNLDWESLARTDLREPFSILNAYYVPDKVRRDLPDNVTPVNSFRIVLSDVFGAKYPPLPERNYYSTESHPYAFVDVTQRLAQIADSSQLAHIPAPPPKKSGDAVQSVR